MRSKTGRMSSSSSRMSSRSGRMKRLELHGEKLDWQNEAAATGCSAEAARLEAGMTG
jgi:hypothetical protein